MAQRDGTTVVASFNQPGAFICVDVFQRLDGSFGFEEYRRDPADGHGWFPIGRYSGQSYASHEAALAGAKQTVAWLGDAAGRPWRFR